MPSIDWVLFSCITGRGVNGKTIVHHILSILKSCLPFDPVVTFLRNIWRSVQDTYVKISSKA